ncbi:MAG: MGMT family protein [Candidatus Diapherotrites archaeon]|nr:MGMT family protein [Candidatus Diapherotrites archaeon]
MVSWLQRIQSYPAPPFHKRVWIALLRIPKGKVVTYQTLARMAGNPLAPRAVGNACNRNPFAPHVPCHRVVAADGGLGGYDLGVRKKKQLLRRENIQVDARGHIDLSRFGYFPMK